MPILLSESELLVLKQQFKTKNNNVRDENIKDNWGNQQVVEEVVISERKY